eukprot:TRINITY_DN67037_c0_g1_i1.p1 TRINITY_DN67037_c0_g1~~TRINITY_DN67037_c0_g1_i1.p1  ORF type:complete len:628 (+),score=111.40 TRINITY_DN67037_c0_g1_i1:56-1939(+)
MSKEGEAVNRKVVIDAGAAIRLQRLERFGGALYTTHGVFNEIRDEKARALLKTLPEEMRVTEPLPQDIAFVRQFAKLTGDLGFLSRNDLDLIALTVRLHRENGGKALRERPDGFIGQPGSSAPKRAAQQANAAKPEPNAASGGTTPQAPSSSSTAAPPTRPGATRAPWAAASDKTASPSVVSDTDFPAIHAATPSSDPPTAATENDACAEDSCIPAALQASAEETHQTVDDGRVTPQEPNPNRASQSAETGSDEPVASPSNVALPACSSPSASDAPGTGKATTCAAAESTDPARTDAHSGVEEEDWSLPIEAHPARDGPSGERRVGAEVSDDLAAFSAGELVPAPSLPASDALGTDESTTLVKSVSDVNCVANEEASAADVSVEAVSEAAEEENDETGDATKDLVEESDDHDDDVDGSSAGEWVTAENIGQLKSKAKPAETLKVTCVSTDYSVQNVLLQMGITPLTFEGYVVKKVRLWGLSCRACFHFDRDTEKIFCAKCGNDTVVRVPFIVTKNGKTICLDDGRKLRTKGTKYSIPKPTGGRGWKPIFAEDETRLGGRDREMRRIQNQREKERIASDPFNQDNTKDLFQRAGVRGGSGGGPRFQAGYGRRVNPNANNFKGFKGKKK